MLRSRRLSCLWLLPILLACSAGSLGQAEAAPPKQAAQAGQVVKPTHNPESQHQPQHQAKVLLTPAGQATVSVTVEVVQKPKDRERGLMFRTHLDDDAGMLFIFESEQQQTFWMHNTLIPLDMIFIQADKSVLGVVENATPRTDVPRAVPGASQYVLEVNAGFCRKHGIEAGTFVRFVDVTQAGPAAPAAPR